MPISFMFGHNARSLHEISSLIYSTMTLKMQFELEFIARDMTIFPLPVLSLNLIGLSPLGRNQG